MGARLIVIRRISGKNSSQVPFVIHLDECIDCGVCEPECPVDAISQKREPPADAKDWEGKPDKAELLSPNPGAGD